jgi:hypothetical protein
MLNIILVVLMFMCGFGGYAAPQVPFRYGLGGLGLLLFVIFCLINLGFIHPGL